MRWITGIGGLALILAAMAGCKQQVFMNEYDYGHYVNNPQLPLPSDLECRKEFLPDAASLCPSPATVNRPDEKPRNISLAECIALALEHGTVGNQSPQGPGTISDSLVSFQPPLVGTSDAIRVLALDPAIVGTNIDASLSKFDARWTTSMTYTNTDQPIGSALQAFQANNNTNTQAIQTLDGTFTTGLLKPLPTGGVAGITFTDVYELTNLPARTNPSYRPTLQFQFEQPLLQGFGIEINQLRQTHPGSLLTPFANPNLVPEGILITRIRFDQQRAEFQRNVHWMLLNVESAYWNLYSAYWNLYSQEQALRQAYEAWRINYAKYLAGRVSVADLAQTRGQYELFRDQRITALGQVLESERQLRGLMGLAAEDGCRLVPIDEPTLAPYNPDWCSALNEALSLRPELVLARNDLKFRQLDLINQKNLLLPDLRFLSTYDINGLGNTMSGPGDSNALRDFASGHFNDWSLGLNMTWLLGERDAHAAVRAARLNLARSYYVLRDNEDKAQRYLAFTYRNLFLFHNRIQALRAQREAFAEQLRARFQEFIAGRGTLDILLEAQRFWATALATEYNVIAQYNSALAAFEFAKGTILEHDNIVISEGPLPACAQVRAAVHEEEKAKALVIRERANPVIHPACDPQTGDPGLPLLPSGSAPSIPSLFEGAQQAPPTPAPPVDGSEPLPNPRKISREESRPDQRGHSPTTPAATDEGADTSTRNDPAPQLPDLASESDKGDLPLKP